MQYPFQFIRLILSGNNTPIYKKQHQTKPETAESEDFMNPNAISENEKRMLQAKHRVEEAEARNRVKEQKARTRRLIQEGAILEKAYPKAVTMKLDALQKYS